MAFNEQKKRRIVAITKQLRNQKGLTIKQSDLNEGLAEYKEAQTQLLSLKEKYNSMPGVVEKIDSEYKKVQKIINDLNEYMSVLHPEGLIDFGSGKGGKQVVSQG